jgi:hypothetical protein
MISDANQMIGHGYMKASTAARSLRILTPTASGLNYLNSLEYERYMIDLVAKYYEPDECFYGFLVGITAALLSESDPNSEETTIFDEFVEKNMQTIRTAIDRIKAKRPELAIAGEKWER